MSDATANYPLGQKITAGFAENQLGQETWFADRNYDGDLKTDYSSREVHCVLVELEAGASAVAPGSFVKWTAPGTKVNIAGLGDHACGQVDPYLNANVTEGERFWVITDGPGLVTASAAISAGAPIKTAASGKVVTNDYANSTGVGYLIAAASADGDKRRALLDCRNI